VINSVYILRHHHSSGSKSCLISFNSSLQAINVLYVVWRKMYAELITRERIKKPTYKTSIVWRLLLKLIRHDFDTDEWWWRRMYAKLITRERIKKTPTYKTFIVWRLLLKLIRHILRHHHSSGSKSCLISFNSSLQTINVLYVVFFILLRVINSNKPTYKTFIVWRLLLKLIRHDFDPDEWWWRKMYAELITRERIKTNQRYTLFFLSFHMWLILHTFYVIIIHLGQSHVWLVLIAVFKQ
jgi:ribosomal protein L17